MYNDIFIENNTVRKTNKLEILLVSVLICLLPILILNVLVNLTFSNFVANILPLVVDGLLIRYVLMKTRIEFEIAYTNGIIDISKIFWGRKRKDLLTFECGEELVVVAPSKSKPVEEYIGARMKTLDCTSHQEVPYYTMIAKTDRGDYKVLLEMTDEMLDAMKRKYPKRVFSKDDISRM